MNTLAYIMLLGLAAVTLSRPAPTCIDQDQALEIVDEIMNNQDPPITNPDTQACVRDSVTTLFYSDPNHPVQCFFNLNEVLTFVVTYDTSQGTCRL